MRLSLLGTGTPRPSIERQCTANLVQIADVNIMVDAGRGAVTQLVNLAMIPLILITFSSPTTILTISAIWAI
ncbi:MAG: hypothetical protein L3J30_10140 [Marinosulfonomonas sp.]|nr:hypothetical protein [Marinosulfonomonas sp.]